MGKLHELLAVEPDLRGAYDQARNRIKTTFDNKLTWFNGMIGRYTPLHDEGESFPDEEEPITEKVVDQLLGLVAPVAAYFDAVYQKELTNNFATADIVVDDETLATSVPATMLLGLEAKLRQIKEVYQSIPTLDPAERWELDETQGVYRTPVKVTFKTQKQLGSRVMYEATPEHPAQVESFTYDVRVGTWERCRLSATLPMPVKVELLRRCDVLLRAVKGARQRANDIEVRDAHVGQALMDYINAGMKGAA